METLLLYCVIRREGYVGSLYRRNQARQVESPNGHWTEKAGLSDSFALQKKLIPVCIESANVLVHMGIVTEVQHSSASLPWRRPLMSGKNRRTAEDAA